MCIMFRFLCCIFHDGEAGVLAARASGEGVTGRRRCCTAAPHSLEPTCVKLLLHRELGVDTSILDPKQIIHLQVLFLL